MLPVGGEGCIGVAVPEFVERGLFPAVLLPPVVGELDRRQSGGEGTEQPAGVDLGQLVWVTDQNDLDLLGVVGHSV